jgi:hypothetical protein
MSAKEKVEKISFYDTERRKAELKIKLHYDGLTQADFFRGVVTAYLSEEENLYSWLGEFKKVKSKIRSSSIRSQSEKADQEAIQITKKFGITAEEIEDMFDLLEEEHPELW